jgi:PTH1 family peptidyl-tRNA hydrolase
VISLVAGLGNIGGRYEGSRHNIGFEVVRSAVQSITAIPQPWTDHYRWARGEVAGHSVWFILPTTYMNNSGQAVDLALHRMGVAPSELLVVCDDLDLPLGEIRVRAGGSDAGQRGVRSIIEVLGTDQFPRLRVGLGRPPEGVDPVEYVLGRFTPEEAPIIEKTVAFAAEAVIFAAGHPLDAVMATYNKRLEKPSAEDHQEGDRESDTSNKRPALPDSE